MLLLIFRIVGVAVLSTAVMATVSLAFRWLDMLEKEFDKAFVDLDLLLGEIDPDQCELTYDGRQKMTALSAAFAQLCHKAQTIFQSNAKLEVNVGCSCKKRDVVCDCFSKYCSETYSNYIWCICLCRQSLCGSIPDHSEHYCTVNVIFYLYLITMRLLIISSICTEIYG